MAPRADAEPSSISATRPAPPLAAEIAGWEPRNRLDPGLLQRLWEFLKRPCPIEMFILRLTLHTSTENRRETEHIRSLVVETALMCNLIVGGSTISSYNAFV